MLWSFTHPYKHPPNTNTNISNSMSMSSSSSSSSSSSPSPSSMFASQTPRRRAMEDVWKDITTTTTPHLHHHHHPHLHHVMMRPPSSSTPSELQPYHHHTTTTTAITTSTSRGAIILQDLLAGTLNRPLPAPPAEGLRFLPLPPALSLNSPGLDFSNSRRTDPLPDAAAGGGCTVCSSYASPGFSSADSPPNIFSLCAKKRAPDSPGNGCGSGGGGGGGDRRHKRMIKNRESAARSRARRQAYTNGLELEVAHLLEENAKLKKEQEELRLAFAAQLPTKNALQRSSSSPF